MRVLRFCKLCPMLQQSTSKECSSPIHLGLAEAPYLAWLASFLVPPVWTGAQGCMAQLEGIWPRGEMPQRISPHASRRSIYLFIYLFGTTGVDLQAARVHVSVSVKLQALQNALRFQAVRCMHKAIWRKRRLLATGVLVTFES